MDKVFGMFDFGIGMLFPFLLVLGLMALPLISRRLQGRVSFIMPFDLMKKLETGEAVTVLDIRPSKDFAMGHVQGALNLSAEDILSKLDTPEKAREFSSVPIAIMCQSDLISIRTANKLERIGLEDVMVVKGGFLGWKRKRLPLVADNT